jgi:hypothetical protein
MDGKWHQVMDYLSNFQIFTGFNDQSDEAFGELHHAKCPKNAPFGKATYTAAMQLSNKYQTFFMHPHYATFAPERIRMMHFSLATTMVHEMAHACWALRVFEENARRRRMPSIVEPLYDTHQNQAELGAAWEIFAFGGFPCHDYSGGPKKVQHAYTLSRRLVIITQDDAFSVDDTSSPRGRPLQNWEIAAFFSAEHWDLFFRIWNGDLQTTYQEVGGENILTTMNLVIFLKENQRPSGEYPAADEVIPSVIDRVTMWEDDIDTSVLDYHNTPRETPLVSLEESTTQQPADYEAQWRALGASDSYQNFRARQERRGRLGPPLYTSSA